MKILFRNTKLGLIYTGVLSLLLLLVIFAVFSLQVSSLRTSIEDTVKTDLKAYSINMDNKIATVVSDVILIEKLIINNDVFVVNGDSVEYSSQESKSRLENDLFDWIDVNRNYDQIRFLDVDGMEMIRINSNNGNPSIVDESQYQDKSTRYYFANAIDLSDETIYLSRLDLNVENGEIEMVNGEPKTMLRIASTVYNSQGDKIGLVIVNYLADNLFHDIETNSGDFTTFEVINNQGFYLHSQNKDIEFGFMYDDKVDEKFSKYHDYDILNIEEDEDISQELFDGELYTSFVINKVKMSDSVSILLDKQIPIYSDNGEIIVFGEVEINETTEFKGIRTMSISIFFVGLIVILVISRLIDEIIFNQEEKIESLEYASNHDSLTGLPNRSYAFNEIKKIHQENIPYTIMFLDFDGFKKVNDNHGHQAGDTVLVEGSRRIKEAIRETDIVARVGGDEFLIVLKGVTEEKIINRISSKIENEIVKPIETENASCTIGVSIGYAIQTGDKDIDEIVNLADEKMYIKKENKSK